MQYWRECASDDDNKIFGCIWFWDIVGWNGPISFLEDGMVVWLRGNKMILLCVWLK